ncbi:MAG: hypothetical protein JW918_05130 [Anaerolineae bacterium]|nr:hypothetical protein [Anaerolineae bacterium]
MTAVQRFKHALGEFQVKEGVVAQIFQGYETVSDRSKKETRAAFFIQAVERMEALLDRELCHEIRDACACSKGGWRLKAMQKIAKECEGHSVEQKLQAIGQVTYMGNPVLNEDGTITAGIGDVGGFPCPCPVFDGVALEQAVSKTYCYCCAGHFRHHYQIALGKRLRTRDVVSSALESRGKEPCRFVFEILE